MSTILIYGEPGCGKTEIVKPFAIGKRIEKPFVHYINHGQCIIGDYHADTPFLGTDKLSMSIQPTIIKFIQQNPDYYYIIEGDRLFNSKFIDSINPKILIIEAPAEKIKQRRLIRGIQQDITFLKAKKTKIENIKSKYAYYSVYNIDEMDMPKIRQHIASILYGNSTIELIRPAQEGLF